MRFQDRLLELKKTVFPIKAGKDGHGAGDPNGLIPMPMDAELPRPTTLSDPTGDSPAGTSPDNDTEMAEAGSSQDQKPPPSPLSVRRKTPPVLGAPMAPIVCSAPPGLGGQQVSSFLPVEMRRDQWRCSDFVIQKRLYEGFSSSVSQAYDRISNTDVALKIYDKARLSELNRAQVEREVRIHMALQHMYIIQLYAAWEDERAYYLVQEFACEGDVFTEVHRRGGQLSEKAAVNLVLQPFLAALHYLHTKNIIHRDIKPENLLFTHSKHLKVADFGLAIDQSIERPVTRAGTLDYMAPEVVVCPSKRRPNENKNNSELAYSEQVDAWSVGILAYELVVGFPPFERESRTATLECIINTDPQFPRWMSDEAADFICRALAKDRNNRPSIPEMLRHPWVQIHERRRSHRNIPTHFLAQGLGILQHQLNGGAAAPPVQPAPFRQTTSFGPQSVFTGHVLPAPALPDAFQLQGSPLNSDSSGSGAVAQLASYDKSPLSSLNSWKKP